MPTIVIDYLKITDQDARPASTLRDLGLVVVQLSSMSPAMPFANSDGAVVEVNRINRNTVGLVAGLPSVADHHRPPLVKLNTIRNSIGPTLSVPCHAP